MKTNIEYCDPFDGVEESFWMKIEHCGRYLWAADQLAARRCRRVADVAAATGYGSALLAHSVAQVIGVEGNAAALAQARRDNAAANIRYLQADLNQLPLPAATQGTDAIVCFETLEHIRQPQALLAEFRRLLPPGGLLLLSVPNQSYERFDEEGCNRDPFHLHTFSPPQLAGLLTAAGFVVQQRLGQDICNRAVTRISQLKQDGSLSDQEADRLWRYDQASLLTLARILGYPGPEQVEQSYSIIYVCSRD